MMRKDLSHRDLLRRIPVGTFLLAWFALVLFLYGDSAEAFYLSRDDLARGAWWQLFTGHFTHWDRPHFLWDVAVFLAVGARCEYFSKKAFWSVIFGGAWAISLVFIAGYPGLASYRGLSGLDSALFALFLVIIWQANVRLAIWFKVLLTLAFVSKMIGEILSQTTVFVPTAGESFVAVPLAHVVGAFWGLCVGLLFALGKQTQ